MKEEKLRELLDLCLSELLGESSKSVTRKIAIDHVLTKFRRNGFVDRFRIKFNRVLSENLLLAAENEKLKRELQKYRKGW